MQIQFTEEIAAPGNIAFALNVLRPELLALEDNRTEPFTLEETKAVINVVRVMLATLIREHENLEASRAIAKEALEVASVAVTTGKELLADLAKRLDQFAPGKASANNA